MDEQLKLELNGHYGKTVDPDLAESYRKALKESETGSEEVKPDS